MVGHARPPVFREACKLGLRRLVSKRPGSPTAECVACSAISCHCCATPWYLLFKTGVVARRASRSHSAALFLYISARDNIACASLALRSVTYSKIIFAAYKCEMDRVMML